MRTTLSKTQTVSKTAVLLTDCKLIVIAVGRRKTALHTENFPKIWPFHIKLVLVAPTVPVTPPNNAYHGRASLFIGLMS